MKAHTIAMRAKFLIFEAQDAAREVTNEALRIDVEAHLAKVRAELEALDRTVQIARQRERERYTQL